MFSRDINYAKYVNPINITHKCKKYPGAAAVWLFEGLGTGDGI